MARLKRNARGGYVVPPSTIGSLANDSLFGVGTGECVEESLDVPGTYGKARYGKKWVIQLRETEENGDKVVV